MAMWNGHDEEDTETHGAIHTREAYEKLSIVYEKVREGCQYDISCVRRYHFVLDFFITNSCETAQLIPICEATTTHSAEAITNIDGRPPFLFFLFCLAS